MIRGNNLYDETCLKCSKITTVNYSTSFSLGIKTLAKQYHKPIYAIYGFVRFADEIVDTFHHQDKKMMLESFKQQTHESITNKHSLNPILHAFQLVVNEYNIEIELIDTFLHSMEMDLHDIKYDQAAYETYILGSAEVVGLMCLRVFCQKNDEQYEKLKPYAMKLGSAFQKINFLRDLNNDYFNLGRVYFPHLDIQKFDLQSKQAIEADIEKDFAAGLEGIKMLPDGARFGVYVAYVYYYALFKKIINTPPKVILKERVRIPNFRKYMLILSSYLKHSFGLI
ncbi:MAG: phytoene/squalene synthase family protein [Flavobacteriales bacterium]